MDLDLSEDQELFRATTRRFIEAETPIAATRLLFDDETGFDRGWWRSAAELGWTALLAPERVGGGSISGRPLADAAIVAEELGRQVVPGPFHAVNLVVAGLAGATDHDDALAGLVAGERTAAWAVGERGDRWDPAGWSTTAVVDGGDVVVRGAKAYVDAGGDADDLLVVGRTGNALTQVLVPSSTPGVTVVPARSLDLARRFAAVSFDDVRLPRSAVVGEIGGADGDVEHLVQLALVLQAADVVGGLDAVFTATLDYMGDRYAFGRPISSYQALKHRVADLLLVLESAKGCVDAAVASVDAGRDDAAVEARVAKAYIGDRSMHLLQECMQFLGGISVTWEHDIHRYLRRATVNRAVYGSPEHHRDALCSLLGVTGVAS